MLMVAISDLRSSIGDQAANEGAFMLDMAAAGGLYLAVPGMSLIAFSAQWENDEGTGVQSNSWIIAQVDGWAVRPLGLASLDEVEADFLSFCKSELPYSPFPLSLESTQVRVSRQELSPIDSLAFVNGQWQKFIAERMQGYQSEWKARLLSQDTPDAPMVGSAVRL
jgi:hypothetical protein